MSLTFRTVSASVVTSQRVWFPQLVFGSARLQSGADRGLGGLGLADAKCARSGNFAHRGLDLIPQKCTREASDPV